MSDVVPNLSGALALQDTHQDVERDGVQDRPDGNAINEPLRKCVPQIEPWLAIGSALRFDLFLVLLGVGQRRSVLVGREDALQIDLPFVVWGGGQETKDDEAKELDDIKGERLACSIGFEELGEYIRCT